MIRTATRAVLNPSTPSTRRLRLFTLGASVLVPTFLVASCGDDSTPPGQATSSGSGGSTADSSSTATGTGGTPAVTSGSGGGGTGGGGAGTVKVQILAINDFHGNLEPPAGSSGNIRAPNSDPDAGADAGVINVVAGGAAYMATHVAKLRANNPNTLVVSSGDLIGASPLTSGLFYDEPAIEAMNLIGLDIHGVGNHEFDDGTSELLRLQYGGCSPKGCVNGMFFPGADFQFLAANVVVDTANSKTLFPSYTIREFEGVKVGFIGMTLKGTPSIVTPAGVAGLTFEDEVATVNKLVPDLQAKGVGTIVVLLHQGGFPGSTSFYNECKDVTGAIVDIAMNMSPAVDVIASAHTHQAYNCTLNGKLVTSASSFGRVITDINLDISKATGNVIDKSAENIIVTRDVEPDADVSKLVTDFVALAAPLANEQIGTVTGDLRTTAAPCTGLSTMGMVIADAQLAATEGALFGNAVVAFMNPGGVRADLVYKASIGEPADGIVRYGEAFTVQPFGNSLTVMTLTGAQIKQALERQFEMASPRILQPSAGFSYTYDAKAAAGSKVDPASIKVTINGQSVAVQADQSYRVTVNSFLATGGDGFTVFNEGTDRLGGQQDIDALTDYFANSSPVSAPLPNRITALNCP
jgi:5'-nucleotidase